MARKYNAAKKFIRKKVIRPYTDKKKHRGYNNRMRLYKEVAALKRMVNAEKQNAQTTITTQYDVAQFDAGGVDGLLSLNPLPIISQGIGEDNRKGDSIKICSFCLDINIQTNAFNTLQDTRYKIYLLRQPTNPIGSVAVPYNFLEPNPFSGVVDFYSPRNYQHFKDFVVLGTISGVLRPNTNNSTGQYRSNTHKLARKCNFHIRYNKGTNDVLNNQLTLLVVASEGDISTNNNLKMQYAMKVYYYDN